MARVAESGKGGRFPSIVLCFLIFYGGKRRTRDRVSNADNLETLCNYPMGRQLSQENGGEGSVPRRGDDVLRGPVCVDPKKRKRTEVNAVDLKTNARKMGGEHALARMIEEEGRRTLSYTWRAA